MLSRIAARTQLRAGSCALALPQRGLATAQKPLRVAIAGAGVSGSILAAQLAKHANVEVTLLERFARGALPPGLNLLLNHNGMGAIGALDTELAAAIRAVGEPMISWSASTLSGRSLYKLGDVANTGAGFAEGDECAMPLADTYGVRGRWRDLTATCQLAAVASKAKIHWRTEISDVVHNGERGASAPLTITLRHAAEIAGGPDSYSNQEELGREAEDASVVAARQAAEEKAWREARVEQLDVDILIGCDGRYSAVRKLVAEASDEVVSYGPPFVSDFRLVVPVSQDDVDAFFSGEDAQDLRRVYNVPHPENVARLIPAAELARPENSAFATHCAAGLARVGVMTIAPSRLDAWGVTAEAAAVDAEGKAAEQLFVGFFGNFKMPEGSNEPIPPIAKTAAGLRAMYTPAGGEGDLDPLGRFVLRTLTENAESVHWTRMQSTLQRVLPGVHADAATPLPPSAEPPSSAALFGGRVLLLGDAAGALYPALGQGANQAIEDACAASHVFNAACARAEAEGTDVDVASAIDAIWELRQPRREFVSDFSKEHSAHIARRDGEASLNAEAADWMGCDGGRFDALPGKATGSWRKGLRQLWSGWQRPQECIEAFGRASRRRAAASGVKGSRPTLATTTAASAATPTVTASATARSSGSAAMRQRGLCTASASPLVKVATTATRETFAPFGDLVSVAPDGGVWSAETDADLVGFDGKQGFPRFYLMALYGPRPFQYDRITHHARVTQCLGAASATEDFYLAVHAPTLGADGVAAPPDPAKVSVFRVAPHTFVKLHRGTWHAGPLWGQDAERVYYNLELHDTNEVDHNTVVFDDMYTFEPCA